MEIAKGTPYGEARRLRYISLIAKLTSETGSIDADLLAERIKMISDGMRQQLDAHIRRTGRIGTVNVAHNYIEFGRWLGIIDKVGHLVSPNGYTLLISEIYNGDNFGLSEKEKIAFIEILLKKEQVADLLSRLKFENEARDFSEFEGEHADKKEHFVQTFFDWYVDLDILRPKTSSSRKFLLTEIGEALINGIGTKESNANIVASYCSGLLKKPVSTDIEAAKYVIDSSFKNSFEVMKTKARSELGNHVYTALPIFLYLQLYLITEHLLSLKLEDIADVVKNCALSKNGVVRLVWNNITSKGHMVVKVGD